MVHLGIEGRGAAALPVAAAQNLQRLPESSDECSNRVFLALKLRGDRLELIVVGANTRRGRLGFPSTQSMEVGSHSSCSTPGVPGTRDRVPTYAGHFGSTPIKNAMETIDSNEVQEIGIAGPDLGSADVD